MKNFLQNFKAVILDNLVQMSPYLIFSAFAIAFFAVYLPQGFSPIDDGYLLGLGHRVAQGQEIYRDFQFYRTPLSVYLQAGMIQWLGDSYTVYASKVFWAVEVTLMVGFLSLIYRRWLDALTLTVTLCATLVYSALLLSFPWYTYDGMFFAVLFGVSLLRRNFMLAGIFAGLAFLCKQSFVVIIPTLYVLWSYQRLVSGSKGFLTSDAWSKMFSGWVTPVAILSGYYLLDSRLPQFIENIYTIPSRINQFPASYIFGQDLPVVLMNSWPFIAALVVVVALIPLRKYPALVLSALVMTLCGIWWAGSALAPASLLTPALYLIGLYTLTYGAIIIRNSEPHAGRAEVLLFLALAMTMVYASSFNYSGIILSHIGGVFGLPALVVSLTWLYRRRQIKKRLQPDEEVVFVAPPAPERQALPQPVELAPMTPKGQTKIKISLSGWITQHDHFQPVAFAAIALVAALITHHNFPYNADSRAELTAEFSSPKLQGVYGSAEQVALIDGLVEYVSSNSAGDDRLFVFPALTSLNYLTNRPAWGITHWHYPAEYDMELAQKTVLMLEQDPPEIVALQWNTGLAKSAQGGGNLKISSEKAELIQSALLATFYVVDTVGPCYMLSSQEPVFESGPDNGIIDTISPNIVDSLYSLDSLNSLDSLEYSSRAEGAEQIQPTQPVQPVEDESVDE
jgi:hypothetical protein